MYSQCTTEKSAQRQYALTMALLEAMKSRRMEEISISELCRASGVSRKQFYQLFSSKSDVILALLDQTILQGDSFQPDPSVAPGELHRFLAFWQSQGPLLDVLLQHHLTPLLVDRCIQHVLQENSRIVEAFGVRNTDDEREMLLFYLTGIFALVMDWHATGYTRTLEQMCSLLSVLMQKSPVKPW